MGWLREDVTAILAITYGAAISAGVTGAFLSRGGGDHAAVRMDVPTVVVRRAPLEIPTRPIPDGYRAVTVEVLDQVAVAGLVRPGARVDLLTTFDDKPGEAGEVAKLVLQDALVLGNDRTVSKDEYERMITTALVTVVVTPEDADKLAMAATEGRLHVILRGGAPERGLLRVKVEKK